MKQMMNAPPAPHNEQEELLWQKIQAFPLDDPDAALPFSRKLCLQQKWTYAFTLGAIAEYRKFVFLCCTIPHGASPSKVIDEVWHLHLLYTQNYWEAFCDRTLGQKLHHHPNPGGPAQTDRHKLWQQETLLHYREAFGKDAPAAYWPENYPTPSKPNTLQRIVSRLMPGLWCIPLVALAGCSGSDALGLLVIPVLLLMGGVMKAISGSTATGQQRKKSDNDHSSSGSNCSSSSGCGSSCSSGCGGGGCGGCGGS